MIDTAKVRAEHVIMDRWGGPGTGRDEGGICSECEQFWDAQCEDLDWCDALDEANAKLTALLNMVPEYAYIQGDDRLVVLHDDMCAVLNGAKA